MNKMESISGIDLDSGKEVFRADHPTGRTGEMSFCVRCDAGRQGTDRVRGAPRRLGLSEYQVEDTRFAVFNTRAGVDAKPIRQFPAPRRVHTLLSRKDGKSFFAIGFDLYEFDRATGKQLNQKGIRNWDYANHATPDLLAFWPVSEPTGVFATPIYSSVPPRRGPATPSRRQR